MARFEDPRFDDILVAADLVADRYLGPVPLANGPGDSLAPSLDPFDRLAAVPDEAVGLLRIAMLRRVVESDTGTAGSLYGELRSRLAGRRLDPDARLTALELAMCERAVDFQPGIALGRMRVSLYDPALDDLEAMDPSSATPELVVEVERATEMLASDALGTEQVAVDRRPRLVGFLHRVAPSRLSPLAFDAGDAYGRTMRILVSTDDELAADLAAVYPLLIQGTKVLPGPRWRAASTSHLEDTAERDRITSAIDRSLRPLLDVGLPRDLPTGPGAVRITNQRLIRGLLWLAAQANPTGSVEILTEIGLRLGTSGRRDSVARDAAVASTCAALLGEIGSDHAAAGLARMQGRVRNRPVSKQVAGALEAIGARSGVSAAEVVEAAIPDHGLDANGRRMIPVGTWTAVVEVGLDGTAVARWHDDDDVERARPNAAIREAEAGRLADVADVTKRIRATIADERGRLDRAFAVDRRWPLDAWTARYLTHPIGRVFGRRLIWRFETDGLVRDAIWSGDVLAGVDGRPVAPAPGTSVSLWHPVEADPDTVEVWRDRLVSEAIVQPIKQAFRETYRPPEAADAVLDRRFADRPLDFGRLRALFRARGWAGASLGPWDQGDAAAVGRDLAEARIRAEFQHQPAGQVGPTDAVDVARSGAVRFVSIGPDAGSPILLARVPQRVFSEVLRDVDLFVATADITRPSVSARASDPASAIADARAAAVRRIGPSLAIAARLTVFGRWVRVEGTDGDVAVSLVDARVLRLPDETEVEPPAVAERATATTTQAMDAGVYLPSADDPILLAIIERARRHAGGGQDP